MMALDVRETYLRDCSAHIYFSRVLLDALSVPPLGQVWGRGEAPRLGEVTGAADFGAWFGPCGALVGNLGASWGALRYFGGVVERIWVSLAPFGRFGVGFLVYFRSMLNFIDFILCQRLIDRV